MISKTFWGLLLWGIGLVLPESSLLAQQTSRIVYEGEDGCLHYVADEENNYIPDFSHAGYRNGEEDIPQVPVVKTIGPVEGDNTAHIQAALDEVGGLPPDARGIRGALLLEPGTYEVHGIVTIRESGVILRGSGNGANETTSTILRAIGNEPAERDVIRAGNASGVDWTKERPGSRSLVTGSFIPAGSRSLTVSNPERYQVGDQVVIFHPSTIPWLASIDYGATAEDANWEPGDINLYYNRYITAVEPEEGKIRLDAPIYDHFDLSLAQPFVFILDEPGIKRNIGIEDLRIVIETAGPTDEAHAKNAIRLIGVEDCWVSGVVAYHFTYAAVDMRVASRVTVRNCFGLQPHSLIDGARRYNFAVGAKTNNVLFENCYASYGRHSFVSNGASSVAGIVFHNCFSEHDYNTSEGHRRWSQGLLFDSLVFTKPETGRLLGLYNRGSYGTGHGWSSVHSVAWNVKLPAGNSVLIQKPPGRQNYGIGCWGIVNGSGPFLTNAGFIEWPNQNLRIPSLYNAQLEDRMTNGERPDAPARLTATLLEAVNAVELNWLDIASRETGYIVECAAGQGAPFEVIATLPANTTTFTHDYSGLSAQDLTYRVSAGGDQCGSAFSNPVQVDRPVAVEEQRVAGLSVYPNPVSEFLTVETDRELRLMVIRNIFGQEIRKYTGNDLPNASRLSLKDLKPGTYFLYMETAEGQSGTVKIIKQ